MNRIEVRSSVLSCTACPLHSSCRAPVPFRGPAPARIAVVGEAPGKIEDEQGKPFVGPSGELVSSWLERAGIDESTVAFLNVVSCYPSRTPTNAEVVSCRKNLDAQLSLIRPTHLLLFGGTAVSSWWRNLRMGDARGLWWKASVGTTVMSATSGLPSYRAWAMATWHPAAVLRNWDLERDVMPDLMRFRIRALATSSSVIPLPTKCLMCGEWAEVWRDHDDRDVTEVAGEGSDGALAWCKKHDGLRMGTAGKGRAKEPVKKAAGKTGKGRPRKKPSPQLAMDLEREES